MPGVSRSLRRAVCRFVGAASLAWALALVLAPAAAAHPHTVAPGDTLWSVATPNGVAVSALAEANGRRPEDLLPVGVTLEVPPPGTGPTVGESIDPVSSESPEVVVGEPVEPVSSADDGGALSATVEIPSPLGAASLAPDAAAAWNEMRAASLRELGIDLYPAGAASGYRTHEQQTELWRRYQAGTGGLAAPPGTSAHELGRAVDLASPEMRRAVDILGSRFGWAKTEAPDEWFHVNYTG